MLTWLNNVKKKNDGMSFRIYVFLCCEYVGKKEKHPV